MIRKASTKTLDTQHNRMTVHFERLRTVELSNLQTELDDITKVLLASKPFESLSEEEVENTLKLQDQQRALEKKIADIKDQREEIDYLTDTADIVFKYYDIIENGCAGEAENFLHKKHSILKYFAQSKKDIDDTNIEEDRASLLERYLEQTETNYVKSIPTTCDKCPICDSVDRTVFYNDGICYCNQCYTIETIIVDHEKPSYKDPPKEISYFCYKRINHLSEWISQIQGKESTEIPAEIYDRILLEIKKQRITNMAEITTSKVKDVLKRLGLNKYYEHCAHILNRLNGSQGVSFTPEIEEKLKQMFKMIQIPFFKHAPKNRKNFLSYSYTIHKCLQLLELDEYLKYFPLLKSRDKTFQMDEIWQKICKELGWEFVRSI